MPKYKCVETIPANVFFKIIEQKELKLLKPKKSDTEADLINTWEKIYDDFHVLTDYKESKELLYLRGQIIFLEYKIKTIKNIMKYIFYSHITKSDREEILTTLRDSCEIDINVKNINQEDINRVLTVEVGIIENDINHANIEISELTKNAPTEKFNYFQSVVNLSNVLERDINENICLAKYIAIEKSARNKIKALKTNSNGG